MQANGMPGETPEDLALQRAILALALELHPIYRTIPELSREFGSKEAVRRAIGKLEDYGLILLHGITVIPTDAAFHCHRLDAW
jgi:hypothetical protein